MTASELARTGARRDLRFVCPACRTPLDEGADGMRCDACGRTYPVVAGILDLRLEGDRYLSLEDDRAKAERLAATSDAGLRELVGAYWNMTPEVPAMLAAAYAAASVQGIARGAEHLRRLGRDPAGLELLDVGCGTGGLVAAAAARGARAIGVDVALRWLVVARRQLSDAGVEATLIAADGARLPFQPGSFDVTTCVETLEHAAEQAALLRSCLDSVRPGGTCYVVTANRYTFAPEPVARLWGVGFLPRRLAASYVRRRRGTRYAFFRPLSRHELAGMVGSGRRARIGPAALPPVPPGAPGTRRVLQRAYERLQVSPWFRAALAPVAPFLEVVSSGAEPVAKNRRG